jgi:putative endonuclease
MGEPNNRQQVGRRGEDLAVAELERQGLAVIHRNWRCRTGEIDIIAVETRGAHRTVVFCEVKCRTGLGFGDPLESITYAKRVRLRQLAAEWLAVSGSHPDAIRLDAVGVVMLPGTTPTLTHVRGIS